MIRNVSESQAGFNSGTSLFQKSTNYSIDASFSKETDKLSLSTAAGILNTSNLDLRNSVAFYENEKLKFSLDFISNTDERLNASGYYLRETKTLSVALNYQFQRAEIVEGKTYLKTYSANLNVNISFEKEASLESFVIKEDIFKFIQRIVKDIADVMKDDGKTLAGVAFKKEDLEEIVKIDDGKFAEKLLAIINLAILTERIKMTMKNEKGENVILVPERIIEEGMKSEIKIKSIKEFNIEIKEISAELIENSFTENQNSKE